MSIRTFNDGNDAVSIERSRLSRWYQHRRGVENNEQNMRRVREQEEEQVKPNVPAKWNPRKDEWSDLEVEELWKLLTRGDPSTKSLTKNGWTTAINGSLKARKMLGFPKPRVLKLKDSPENKRYSAAIFEAATEGATNITLANLKNFLKPKPGFPNPLSTIATNSELALFPELNLFSHDTKTTTVRMHLPALLF
tara:strand:+ start:233 stop:814 length:582 start_codon:yes stop_codon:yes gene_type:complete